MSGDARLAAPLLRILARRVFTLVWIAVKLILVAAMMNRNVAQFVYARF
jgi:hypothetical protein